MKRSNAKRYIVCTDATTSAKWAEVIIVDTEEREVCARYHADTEEGTKRERADKFARDLNDHDEEHKACEHLDGAVPFVACRRCGDTFGYHAGHEGDWRTCMVGLCDLTP